MPLNLNLEENVANDKRAALAERLYHKTKEGALKWEATAEDGVYQVAFPGYALHIGERERNSEPFIFVRLYDADGTLMEDYDDGDLKEMIPSSVPGSIGFYTLLSELYSGARRAALGVDRALDNILKELG